MAASSDGLEATRRVLARPRRCSANALARMLPATHAALARIKPGNPPVAARFEVFAAGIELANGFAELTDPVEQRRRFSAELDARRAAGRATPPLDEAFLAAVEHLPACAGVALGLDRLVALAGGFDGIAGAMAFVHQRNA